MMDRKEIIEFVKEVLGPNVRTIDTDRWVSISCPLAQWTHGKGRDSRPSAGISVRPGDVSIFNCQTCHRKGPLSYLLRQLERYTGEDWGGHIESLEHGEFFGGYIPKWGGTVDEDTDKLPEPIDRESYFDLYDSAEDHPYLRSRGVTKRAAKTLELLHDPGDNRDVERIMFPVYDRRRNLYGFSGRAVD